MQPSISSINYAKEYDRLHKAGFFNGISCLKQKDAVKQLVVDTDSKTVLDYGSGKGHQYTVHNINKYWNVSVDCYDPYVKDFCVLQDKVYDGVICSDVLEHVPEDDLDEALGNIFKRATKFVFLCIFIGLAKKKFSDGTNVHVNLKTEDDWINRVAKHNIAKVKVEIVFRYPKK
jgi:hypothetical protein